MSKRDRWRYMPDPATAHAIQQMAKRESRSIANATLVLLKEALDARRKFDGTIEKIFPQLRTIKEASSAP